MTTKIRFLSGMRPAGEIHLKHIMVIREWIKLRLEFDCVFGIYNSLALTTTDPDIVHQHTLNLFKGWLVGGLDPEKDIIFAQTLLPENAQMFQLLLQAAPINVLEKGIVYKKKLADKERVNAGILTYPLQEMADVLLFQAPAVTTSIIGNVEVIRELTRKICHNLKLDKKDFIMPKIQVTPVPSIPGFDGKRTSGTKGNYIRPIDSLAEINQKFIKMPTDSKRHKINSPGNPSKCKVFKYYLLDEFANFTDKEKAETLCSRGEISCVQCKQNMAKALYEFFTEYRERFEHLQLTDEKAAEMLVECSKKASLIAQENLKKYQEIFKVKF